MEPTLPTGTQSHMKVNCEYVKRGNPWSRLREKPCCRAETQSSSLMRFFEHCLEFFSEFRLQVWMKCATLVYNHQFHQQAAILLETPRGTDARALKQRDRFCLALKLTHGTDL